MTADVSADHPDHIPAHSTTEDTVTEQTTDGAAGAEADAATTAATTDVSLLEREGDIAADYLEALLDIADMDGDIDIDVEGSRAAVSIVGADLSRLVGPEGETLEALQELTRLAVHRETGVRSRLMLDVGGHRAARRRELTDLGQRSAESVRDSGEMMRLDPMTPFERKVVHDAVAAVEGVVSESEGEEPQRRIVIRRG
jgi:spoIIIJ-associated protein